MNLTLDLVQSWLQKRPADSHKGMFGHVLVVGGDDGMPGAVRLTGEGALRVGAGLVTVLTRKAHVCSTVTGCPELLCYGVDSDITVLDTLLEKATFIVLGPGLGQSAWSKQLFDKIIVSSLPMLIDADGLNWLAIYEPAIPARSNWILTPHPGEAARLLGISVKEVQANRMQSIQSLQAKYGGVIVLKGVSTLVAAKDQPIQCCLAGNPGMASAGMGDLLSGIIAGFAAQGLSLWQAAQIGVMFHAVAGDRAAAKYGDRGLLAHDLLTDLSN